MVRDLTARDAGADATPDGDRTGDDDGLHELRAVLDPSLAWVVLNELEVDSTSTSAAAFTGEGGASGASVEYLVDKGAASPARDGGDRRGLVRLRLGRRLRSRRDFTRIGSDRCLGARS